MIGHMFGQRKAIELEIQGLPDGTPEEKAVKELLLLKIKDLKEPYTGTNTIPAQFVEVEIIRGEHKLSISMEPMSGFRGPIFSDEEIEEIYARREEHHGTI